MNKIIVNLALALCTIALCVACFVSIYSDIAFEEEKADREKKVIATLLKIREAEEAFKKCHPEYCGDIDSLIDFIKNEKTVDRIIKEGELTDDQLEAGMTEAEGIAKGYLKRDTVWVSAAEALGITNADSLKLVPIGKPGATIQLRKNSLWNSKNESYDILVEVRARLDDYLDGMDEKKLKSLKNDLSNMGKNQQELESMESGEGEATWYGLRIGDLLDSSNKMAGNWE